MTPRKSTRRAFVKQTVGAAGAAALVTRAPFEILARTPAPDEVIGHGDFTYRVHRTWGDLDPDRTPVQNCHEMVQDRQGRLLMVTDATENNIIIYDRSGKLLGTWGHDYPGGHGLTLWEAGDEEFLFICDPGAGRVDKTTLDGQVLMTLDTPHDLGEYTDDDAYRPTETTIGPNGDIYVADGYGSQYILQFAADGSFVRKFGGQGDEDAQFQTAHGVAIDTRDADNPTLLCTSRSHNAFKRFTLDGEYVETIFLPGAFVCRPVIDDDNLYAGVCWSRLRYLNRTPDSGFVTILDRDNRVVSNPGGTAPEYRAGDLQVMVQSEPIFKHCHDVCIDGDKNIYVCQWNADQTYPIKLERI